ncbi:unnamed protein product [Acanthoscelides obtectus]|uniref:Uncharacterized protein n=1 Tax=Acanthoscelides obtectus TaxID=200917 RepID=A0A9P0K255_ACAOB|nr:unnamed protein product [Acanthoscelides obtectus]CAK1660367.1 hypothetical protein AOBTE_LOCUS22022 [Acanthoscelides obtectus]
MRVSCPQLPEVPHWVPPDQAPLRCGSALDAGNGSLKDFSSKHWTCSGTKTASSAVVVTADLVRSGLHCTPKRISSFVRGTTLDYSARRGTVQRVTKSFPHSRW